MGTQLSQEQRTFALRCSKMLERVPVLQQRSLLQRWRHKGPEAAKNLYEKIQNSLHALLREFYCCRATRCQVLMGSFHATRTSTRVEITGTEICDLLVMPSILQDFRFSPKIS